ncbi:hypothetical protein HPB47_025798 [Ixodes persulcatus]|uniref:Uncharacterized protein n=1 Tax=Ixodes persulcatus TaxID=34615 RepID=A0AC60Q145_IXOPE|nr:hypothetical protein HPB47_025798 [Ixodes persulcatus]
MAGAVRSRSQGYHRGAKSPRPCGFVPPGLSVCLGAAVRSSSKLVLGSQAGKGITEVGALIFVISAVQEEMFGAGRFLAAAAWKKAAAVAVPPEGSTDPSVYTRLHPSYWSRDMKADPLRVGLFEQLWEWSEWSGVPAMSPRVQRCNTVENVLTQRELGHPIRMANASSTEAQLERISYRPRSRVGMLLAEKGRVIGTPESPPSLPPLNRDPRPLAVDTNVPGIHWRERKADNTARQLAEAHLEQEYGGWRRDFADGYLRPVGGSRMAASVFPDSSSYARDLLSRHHATSTTVKLAAIDLTLGVVEADAGTNSWVIISDSQAALVELDDLTGASPLARLVADLAVEIGRVGRHWLAFQWVPDHCSLPENEEPDRKTRGGPW